VLFHPRGEHGWHPNIFSARLNARGADKKLTARQYAAYFTHDRGNEECHLFNRGGRLFQEWLVDQYCRIEIQRLDYLRFNQKKIRAELYQGVVDAVEAGETTAGLIGRPFILPSSFVGGPRYMAQSFQDAMALVRKFGKPDLFITMTCNPKWIEISRELKEGETANDRPDLVARVFRIKLQALLDDLFKQHVFGKAQARIFVVEFQKRGLPHAHILLILTPENKPKTVDEIDSVVSAELPDPETHPRLFKAVTSFMLHGPCGDHNTSCPCMDDFGCSKGYPKTFHETTFVSHDGYPEYRRRADDRVFRKTPDGFSYDNSWVVPYNPYLLLKYNCHINVEVCTSIQAVKYLFKYVYKGHDRAAVQVGAYEWTLLHQCSAK
jgi:hypothetical protein